MAQGLFGAFSRRRFREEEPSTAGPPLVAGKAAAAPGASTPPAHGRGLFGRFGRALSPNGLQIIGSTLRQIDGEPDAINQQLMMLDEMQRRAAEEGRDMMTDRRTEEFVSSLPQELQGAARVAPREAAGAMFQQQEPQQPKYDSASGVFWIPDPTQPEGYRILGRNPHWQPPRPLIGMFGYGTPQDDGYDYGD